MIQIKKIALREWKNDKVPYFFVFSADKRNCAQMKRKIGTEHKCCVTEMQFKGLDKNQTKLFCEFFQSIFHFGINFQVSEGGVTLVLIVKNSDYWRVIML